MSRKATQEAAVRTGPAGQQSVTEVRGLWPEAQVQVQVAVVPAVP